MTPAVCLSAALAALIAAPPATPPATAGKRELVDRIIAVVNEDVITYSELKIAAAPLIEKGASDQARDSLYRAALDQIIAEKLLTQQVREAKIDVSNDEIDRAIDDILRQNNITRADLKQAIEQRGMSMAQYRSDVERQLVRLKLVDLKVRSRVVIPEADIRAEFEKQHAMERSDELVRLRHLFFRWGESPDPTERARVLDRATKARDRILKGEDFAKVATEVSEGPTASSGGELGEVSKQSLLPELARALGKLKAQEVSTPIETDNGVHVVRIESTRSKDSAGYEQARAQLYQRLYQQEVDRQMRLWIDELRTAATIDVRL